MKRLILILVVIVLLASGWYGYKLYTGKVPSLTEVKADVKVSAKDLIAAFEKDSAAANKIYLGKIVEVEGLLKAIDTAAGTVALGETGSTSSVRCSMDSSFVKTIAGLNVGNLLTIKGACTGFMPDETGLGLGSDVVLNRCVLKKD